MDPANWFRKSLRASGVGRQLRLLDNNTAPYRKHLSAAERRTRHDVFVSIEHRDQLGRALPSLSWRNLDTVPSTELSIDRPWSRPDQGQRGRNCRDEHGNPPARSRYEGPRFDDADDRADRRRPQAAEEQHRCSCFDRVRPGITQQDPHRHHQPQLKEANSEPVTKNMHDQRSHGVGLSITEAFDYSPPERGLIPPRSGLQLAWRSVSLDSTESRCRPNPVDPEPRSE